MKTTAPSVYICPITNYVMKDPVMAADGITYERRAIELWLQSRDYNIFGNPLKNKILNPNVELKATIANFAATQKLEKEFAEELDEDEINVNIFKMHLSIEGKKLKEKEEALARKKQLQNTVDPQNVHHENENGGINKRKAKAIVASDSSLPDKAVNGIGEEGPSKKLRKDETSKSDKEAECDPDIIFLDSSDGFVPTDPFIRSSNSLNLLARVATRKKTSTASAQTPSENSEKEKSDQDKNHKASSDINNEHQFSIKTRGEGDCAFHATFGQFKGGLVTYDDVPTKRKEMADAIRKVKNDSPIYPLIIRGIQAILMEELEGGREGASRLPTLKNRYSRFLKSNHKRLDDIWNTFEALLKSYKEISEFIMTHTKNEKELTSYKQKFHHCLNIDGGVLYGLIMSIDSLNTHFETYTRESNQGFDLDQLVDANILNEYANYVQRPSQWLLPLELKIIAHVFNINIKFYNHNRYKNINVGPDDYNEGGNPSVAVVFDGRGHYERVNERFLETYRKIKKEAGTNSTPSTSITSSVPTPSLTRKMSKGNNTLLSDTTVLIPAANAKKTKKKKKAKFQLTFSEFEHEAENGSVENQYNLALAYYYGGKDMDNMTKVVREVLKDVVVNYSEAYKWFNKVIELYPTDNAVLNYLGQMEFLGEGVAENKKEGLEKLELAAKLGSCHAQYFLGILYRYGEEPIKKNEARAFELFEQAANSDHVEAQINLAEMFAVGISVSIDDNKALMWYRKAAEQCHPSAQNQLGIIYLNGLGTKQDEKMAYEFFNLAAQQGNVEAQNNLAMMLEKGLGVSKKDETEAFNLFMKAAMKDNIEAQMNLATMYALGQGTPKDERQAFHWYLEAANAGNPEAQFYVGNRYAEAMGIERSDVKACEYYRRAAEQNYPEAQNYLGEMYKLGQGVGKNLKTAFEWFEKAAKESAAAQFNLAEMYSNGNEFVPKDEGKAFIWYKKAADQGNAAAQHALAEMHRKGRGTKKDEKEAFRLVELAAKQNFVEAQCSLGTMYFYGIGVQKNEKEAYNWYNLAAKNEHSEALCRIAQAYYSGNELGLSKSYNEAFRHWQTAANKMHARSQYAVGFMYNKGYGVKQDNAAAKIWWERAAKQGEGNAIKTLAAMQKPRQEPSTMTPMYALQRMRQLEEELAKIRNQFQQQQATVAHGMP